MSPEIRKVTESEFPEWMRAFRTGFLMPPTASEEEMTGRRGGVDLDRTTGVVDGGRWVATYRTFPQWVAAPGGARIPTNAITNVSVSATHRRRGLLSRMITEDLAAAKERGDVLASLISAEYPIYGRYGFGVATWIAEWTVDLLRGGLDRSRPLPGSGRIDLVDAAEVRTEGPVLHERVAALVPGLVSRNERWWRIQTGEITVPSTEWTEPLYALYRSASGEVEGLAVFASDGEWSDAKQPRGTVRVRDLLALTPDAERALWHFVCSLDWVTAVRTGRRSPDDLLPLLLPDARAAQATSLVDGLWLRVLDVPRALESRTYDTSAGLVLDIHDPLGLAAGRYRLEVSPDGASAAPTDESADLTLGVDALAALYLGDASPLRLAAVGALEESRAGAVRLAERVFRTPVRPWCPDVF
ncbi:GNAT family N-acetyltransferase [Streptomyces sp. NPDC000594]|uniref:GNAT family N-acetyltransferase n=1 Tax=Streptomyces sp. NPDC000594 TaxID=3154261 RepID=UPI003322A1B1